MQPESAGAQIIELQAHRLAKAAVAASQDAVDYVNAVTAVSRYALAIERAELPVLVVPPDGYTDFVDAYANAKLRAMDWMKKVVDTVAVVPRALVDYGETAGLCFTAMQQSLEALRANPGDRTAKDRARVAAQGVKEVGAASAAAIAAVDGWIASYLANLQSDAARLEALRDRVAQATAADMGEVARLQAVSARLQELIDDRNKLSTLNSFSSLTLNLFFAAVGTVVGLPFSTLTGAVAGGAVGLITTTATTFKAVHPDLEYVQSLSVIQKDMDTISAEVGLLNATVAQLATLAAALGNLVAQGGTVRAQVSKVTGFWRHQKELLLEMVAELDRIAVALDRSSIDAASLALRNAKAEWGQVVAALGEIRHVRFTVEPRTIVAVEVPALKHTWVPTGG